jgi:HK97 family phage prohead protease
MQNNRFGVTRFSAPLSTRFSVGAREFTAVVSNSDLAADGLRIVTRGLNITQYQKNPVLLFSHNIEKPIGKCNNLKIVGDNLIGDFSFAPEGVSDVADTACGLLKSGSLNATSIGFTIVARQPRAADGTQTITEAILNEVSLVSVPALNSALIIARSADNRAATLLKAAANHIGTARDHHRSVGQCLDRDDLSGAARPCRSMRDNLRAAAGALDECTDCNLPYPSARADDLLDTARRHAHDAGGHHRRLAVAIDRNRPTDTEDSFSELGKSLRRCDRALDSLDKIGPTSAASGGKLGILADFSAEGTSKTLGDQTAAAGVSKTFGYRPTGCQELGLWLAKRAAWHAAQVGLPPAGSSASVGRHSFAARQAEKQRLCNVPENPRAMRAALDRIFR